MVKAQTVPPEAENNFVDVKDTVSNLYGTGFDVCGTRSYFDFIDDGNGVLMPWTVADHPWYSHSGGHILIATTLDQYISYTPNVSGKYGTTGYTIEIVICLDNYNPA